MPYQGIMVPRSPHTIDRAMVAMMVGDLRPDDQSRAIERQNEATEARNAPALSAARRYDSCGCAAKRTNPRTRKGAQNPVARTRFAQRTVDSLKE